MDKTFICPCCGHKLIMSKEGTDVVVSSFFDKKQNQTETAIRRKLTECGYEFGIRGGENE